MKLKTCLEVAARIWCDKDMVMQVMDTDLCTEIAEMLYKKYSNSDPVKSKDYGPYVDTHDGIDHRQDDHHKGEPYNEFQGENDGSDTVG